jgi:TonB family protein
MFQFESNGQISSGSRKWGGSVLSVGVHIVSGMAAIAISQMVPATPPKAMKSALTYMAAVTMPVVPDEAPTFDVPAMELARLEPVEVPVIPQPEVAPQPLPEIARAEVLTPMPAVVPQVVQPKVAEPPPAKEISVGAFAAADVPIKAVDARQQTAAAGFDAAPQQLTQNARQTAAIVDAGFGATVTAKPSPQMNAVADTGFGDAMAGAKAPAPPKQQVADTGFFDTAPARQPVRPTATPQRVDVPLEVLSKPSPAYTAEARQMRVEGEVSLEVEFCAAGNVRVLRVVRGLGHGLDEEAVRAAEKIKFKPAQSSGRSVDFKTTVHISFRLS